MHKSCVIPFNQGNRRAYRKQISKLKIAHKIEETAKNLNIPYRINLKSHRFNY